MSGWFLIPLASKTLFPFKPVTRWDPLTEPRHTAAQKDHSRVLVPTGLRNTLFLLANGKGNYKENKSDDFETYRLVVQNLLDEAVHKHYVFIDFITASDRSPFAVMF
jgi:hypothetical protein